MKWLSWWCSGVLLCIATTLAGQTPSGWQTVKSPKPLVDHGQTPGAGGQCRIALPHDWVPGLKYPWATNMNSPPSANRANVSLREFSPSQSFADAKKGVTRYDRPGKVFEDSDKRYWYNSIASNDVLTEWEVVVAGHPACHAHIGFNSAAMVPLARQIALSLAPAH